MIEETTAVASSCKHTNIKGCFSLKGPTVPITALPSESIIVGDSGSSMIFKGGKISGHIFLHQMVNKKYEKSLHYRDYFLVIWRPFWWVNWLQE